MDIKRPKPDAKEIPENHCEDCGTPIRYLGICKECLLEKKEQEKKDK